MYLYMFITSNFYLSENSSTVEDLFDTFRAVFLSNSLSRSSRPSSTRQPLGESAGGQPLKRCPKKHNTLCIFFDDHY